VRVRSDRNAQYMPDGVLHIRTTNTHVVGTVDWHRDAIRGPWAGSRLKGNKAPEGHCRHISNDFVTSQVCPGSLKYGIEPGDEPW
jgi:hypothetical protein